MRSASSASGLSRGTTFSIDLSDDDRIGDKTYDPTQDKVSDSSECDSGNDKLYVDEENSVNADDVVIVVDGPPETGSVNGSTDAAKRDVAMEQESDQYFSEEVIVLE